MRLALLILLLFYFGRPVICGLAFLVAVFGGWTVALFFAAVIAASIYLKRVLEDRWA